MIRRRPRRVLAAAATCAGLALAGAPAADAVPSVTFRCTPAPQDCAGWFRSNVAINWTWLPSDATVLAGCQDKTYTTDTPGTNDFCRVSDGSAETTVQLKIRRDATPPVVTGGFPARAADANGWYNHAVLLSFRGTDQTSGVAACTSTVYGGPDSASASVAGRCTDKAGNTSSPLGYLLKYDATGPEVSSVRPDRAPDAFGWFTRPVRLDVFGADALSGLAECPSTIYGGPDGLAAQASVACRDRAANTSTRAFALSYDDTAPRIARLVASPGDRRIDVRWRRAPDAVSVKVVRVPGRGSAAESVVYSGPGRKFRDLKVRNGKRYTYRVRLADAAGHVTCEVRLRRGGAQPRFTRPSSDSQSRSAAGVPLDAGAPCRLLQPADLPQWPQDPQCVAGHAAIPRQAEMDVRRTAPSPLEGRLHLVRVAGLRDPFGPALWSEHRPPDPADPLKPEHAECDDFTSQRQSKPWHSLPHRRRLWPRSCRTFEQVAPYEVRAVQRDGSPVSGLRDRGAQRWGRAHSVSAANDGHPAR